MNKNWIVLVFALLALASCSVEKRVYQPGYHIEWNHSAARDLKQDASQDLAQDATQGVSQDVAQDVSQDASQDVTQEASRDVATAVAQEITQDEVTGARLRKEKMVQLIQSVTPVQINSATAESELGQKIDSDLALILFILLALFLPALTVFLLEGFSKNFWIALLLMICAFSISLLPLVVRVILEAIAIIMAIAVVLNNA